jgi:peptide/nickel transport system permease protein
VCTLVATAGVAIPDFWLGLLLIILFAVKLHLLPSVGYVPIGSSVTGWSSHILLPALALCFQTAAYIARQLRIALADVVQRQYIVTARAKGLRQPMVYGKHALKNAFIPTITVIGLQMAGLLGGATIIEQVFGIPGLGSLLVQSVGDKDIPTIQGLAVVFALGVLICNLLVDLSYSYFNPKVRVS